MLRFIRSLSRDERGVSALEYAVLAGIIVIVVVAAGAYLKGDGGIPGIFKNVMSSAASAVAASS